MKILITCGPTWVPIDDMRVISNQSTGELGHMLVEAFLKRKAKVTLVEGPVTHALKVRPAKVLKYRFFDELKAILKSEVKKDYDWVVHAAAVSDFRLKNPSPTKINSRRSARIRLDLAPTEKLVNGIKKLNPKVRLVGFKLESKVTGRTIPQQTRALLRDARCDLVVANQVKGNRYQAYILDQDGGMLATAADKKQLVWALAQLMS